MTDYDDVRSCCTGADICKDCWPLMTIAIKVVDHILKGELDACLSGGMFTYVRLSQAAAEALCLYLLTKKQVLFWFCFGSAMIIFLMQKPLLKLEDLSILKGHLAWAA